MTVGVRHDDLRRRNRAMVVGAVRRAAQPSRTEIAATTRLSNSTISAISSDLIAQGALVEIKSGEAALVRRGRPQVALGLAPGFASVVSVVLTLNQLWTSLISYDGAVADEAVQRLPTMTMGKDELAEAVVEAVRRLLQGAACHRRPARIALAVQGTTDSSGSRMLWSPITPHSDIAFATLLEERLGIPATIHNDCNMIAVALKWRWPQRYGEDFFAVLLSNGIGMGLMQKGQLFTGTHSSGGEFGHMIHVPRGALCRCGRRGCIEAYAGSYALVRSAAGGGDTDPPAADIGQAEIEALADAARASQGRERAAFHRAGEAIGYGMGNLFALFDPAPVAIVGPGALAFDILEGPIRAAIAQTAGGQHSGAISFATEPDEMPLVREGCTMTALAFVDDQVAARGTAGSTANQPGRATA